MSLKLVSLIKVILKLSEKQVVVALFVEYIILNMRPPLTAELPIIAMPNDVILTSPNNSHQIRYIKFSRSRAASNYVQSVKSSSSNIGFGVGGFYQLFVGDVSGSYASSSDKGMTRVFRLIFERELCFHNITWSQISLPLF